MPYFIRHRGNLFLTPSCLNIPSPLFWERRGGKMSLWELVKKGAEEGLEVLKDGVWVAGKNGRILGKKVELASVQNNVRKIFARLGRLAYEFHPKGEAEFYGNEEVRGLIAQVDGLKISVRKIGAEMENIRREERRKASEIQEQPPIFAM
jgi:hypothetical protein